MARATTTEAGFDESRWRERLHAGGLRATTARLAVLRALSAQPAPAAAQDIIDAVDPGEADRVTVYRTLNSLVEAGLAHRMDPGDRVWRFGILGDAHDRHAHFVCDACGTVRCLADATISVAFKGRKAAERFRVRQQDVYLHGTCEGCADGVGG
ncbi:MAG TPA: transcriptional repressor [Phycisphaerales bacterium]|nr:transcriptional repressor [Phycisphaerales bacterium]